jgi:endonuclease G
VIQNKFILLFSLFCLSVYGQGVKTITTDIFTVEYSEVYQQPLNISYKVECTGGDVSRLGMSFKTYPGVITSDDADYVDNVWDKGHLAPAADFNCSEDMLKGTFTYLNCALQHEGLNRGPWKELERFERDLAKVYAFVTVEIKVHFEDNPKYWLKTGALVPVGFSKTIICDGEWFEFYFPNKDVAGHDWSEFKTN